MMIFSSESLLFFIRPSDRGRSRRLFSEKGARADRSGELRMDFYCDATSRGHSLGDCKRIASKEVVWLGISFLDYFWGAYLKRNQRRR